MSGALAEVGPDLEFQTRVADGRLWFQHCCDCENTIFYPRVLCNRCSSTSLEWRPATGQGTVYSKAVLRRRSRPDDTNPTYHAIILVDLDEGPRIMSRLPDLAPEDIHIGMRVRARIEGDADKHVVVFDPDEKGGA